MSLQNLFKAVPTSSLAVAVIAMLVLIPSCKKEEHEDSCWYYDFVVTQAYASPVWHPNGTLLGFNHIPLKPVTLVKIPDCTYYSYLGNYDSTGFYLMNKDRTGFRRATRFSVLTPAWSPDGKWLAFGREGNIYKMPFDGNTLDTTQMIMLTTEGHNSYPVWTANSDTIYYTSNVNDTTRMNLHAMWKMSGDGKGKMKLTNGTVTGDLRELSMGSDNRIYHNRWVNLMVEVFSMKKDGSDPVQLTTTANAKDNMGGRRFVKLWQGKIYYQASDGIYAFTPGGLPTRIINEEVHTFDISVNGELVYSRFNYNIKTKDEHRGTLWVTNLEGGNKQQLTFNTIK